MTLRDPTHIGPDHNWYEHRRSALSAGSDWPERHRSAAFILIRVHALEINTPQDFTRDPRWRIDFGNYSPEYRSHSLMEYGNRIGVFRLLDFLQSLGWKVGNVDATIIAQAPKMAPHIPAMTANIAADLGCAPDRINVKATTTEKLGFTGRGEGIAAQAICLLSRA